MEVGEAEYTDNSRTDSKTDAEHIRKHRCTAIVRDAGVCTVNGNEEQLCEVESSEFDDVKNVEPLTAEDSCTAGSNHASVVEKQNIKKELEAQELETDADIRRHEPIKHEPAETIVITPIYSDVTDKTNNSVSQSDKRMVIKQEKDDADYGITNTLAPVPADSDDDSNDGADIKQEALCDREDDVEITAIKQEPIDDSIQAPVIVKPADDADVTSGITSTSGTSSTAPKPHKPQHAFLQQIMASRGASIVATSAGNRVFHCEHCSEQFPHYANLVQHQRQKHKPCHICGKPVTATGMKAHVERHNRAAPTLTCKTCNKRFWKACALREHQAIHLKNRKKYACKVCSKAYLSVGMLKRHEAMHEKPADYTCKICGKFFKKEYMLRYHLQKHSDKVFRCDQCNKAYSTKQSLRCHQVAHTSRHKCQVCGKQYSSLTLLKRHKFTHANVCFMCKECLTVFKNPFCFIRHNREKHNIKYKEADIVDIQ